MTHTCQETEWRYFLQALLGPLLGPFSTILFSTFANQNGYYIPAHIRTKKQKQKHKNQTSKHRIESGFGYPKSRGLILSGMAFSIYEVDRVACQSRSWFAS